MGSHQGGLEAYKQGNYEQAAILFWDALKEHPSAELWNDWASAQLALGLTGPAEQGFRRALALDPKLSEAASNLQLLLVAFGCQESAVPFPECKELVLNPPGLQRMAQALADHRRAALSTPPHDSQKNGSLFASNRINAKEITEAIQVARNKFPQRRVIVLHDGLVASADPHIDCRRQSLDEFSALDFSNFVFVYACSWHFHGASFIRCVISKSGRFIPVWNNGPASYVDQNPVARRVLEAEWVVQRREKFDKWDCGPGDFVNLCQALEITRQRKGAFLELGCFRGSSGSVALRYMRESGIYRDAYFFDVFQGFNYSAALSSPDAVWMGSHETEGPEVVAQRLKRHEQPELGLKVFVRRHNIIEEEIPRDLSAIAVAVVDVDLYEAVLAALTKIAPRMVLGGIMIVEDPGHTPQLVGARVALDDFLASRAASDFMPIYLESGHTFLIKTDTRGVGKIGRSRTGS